MVHPARRGSQWTDADLLGVRFRHRAEFAFDHQTSMAHDQRLGLSSDFDDVVIVEVTRNQCKLNGPWTDPDRQNVHRILAAIGCLRCESIPEAAQRVHKVGVAVFGDTRIRLVAVGRNESAELREQYPNVLQLEWNEIIAFMWGRFREYRPQKQDVQQWDRAGGLLRRLAENPNREEFVGEIVRKML